MTIEKQGEFNGEIKAIFRGGKIKRISWGGDAKPGEGWSTWTEKQQLEYAMELASAMNQAAEILQNERNALLESRAQLSRQLDSARRALDIQKMINTESITSANVVQQEMGALVAKLQVSERKLKNQVAQMINIPIECSACGAIDGKHEVLTGA